MKNNQVLTDIDRIILKQVMNIIIPSNDELPAAGDLGVLNFIEVNYLKHKTYLSAVKKIIAAIKLNPITRLTGGFSSLDNEEKVSILEELEIIMKEDFSKLIAAVYSAYYSDSKTLSKIGWDIKSPQPEGFVLKEWDEQILDQVKTMTPFWKKV